VTGGIAATSIAVDPLWFDGHERYLGISLGDGPELSPRTLITAAPYALAASQLVGTFLNANIRLVKGSIFGSIDFGR
jgi:hypothetical protein